MNGAVEKVLVRGDRRIRVGLAGPGKTFGYESLIDGQPSPVTAITRERSLLLVLPHGPFEQLFNGEDAGLARLPRRDPAGARGHAATDACASRPASRRACRTPVVKANRSIPQSTVIPVLIYPDVREAVAWLSDAFGFAERVQIGEDHRSQLRFGDGAVIVGDVRHDRRPPRPGEVTHSVMVRVDDANAHCEHARAHGAKILMEPTDFEYGERQYAAEDPAGHQWTFSETLHDVAPEEWGGILHSPERGLRESRRATRRDVCAERRCPDRPSDARARHT